MRHLFSPTPQPPLETVIGFFYYFSCQLSLIFVIVNQPFLSAVRFLKYLDDIQSSVFFLFFFFAILPSNAATISDTITKGYQISHIKNNKLTANATSFSSNIVTLALHLPPFPSSFCTYYYFPFLLYLWHQQKTLYNISPHHPNTNLHKQLLLLIIWWAMKKEPNGYMLVKEQALLAPWARYVVIHL